jgi:peptidoglycan/LPS O-acetylase OafA/YrhL
MTADNITIQSAPGERSAVLDCARGLACLAVVNWHLMLAFRPMHNKPTNFVASLHAFYTSPLHFFCNGQAAVVFFFVLSGCVLSQQFFQTRNLTQLHRALIKRYPRLVFSIFVINLSFSIVAALHGVYATESSVITGSSWLETWGLSSLHVADDVSVAEAIKESLFTCFTGSQRYNSSLWTMRIEFLGSVFLMCSLPVLYGADCRRRRIAIYCLLFAVSYRLNANFPAFFAGALATDKHLTSSLQRHIGRGRAAVTIALLFLALGKLNTGWYFHSAFNSENAQRAIHTCASFVLILWLLSIKVNKSSYLFRVLTSVGNNSFAIYLLHVPIILTITSFIHISLHSVLAPWQEFLILASCTHCISLLCAIPVSTMDRWWCSAIDRIVKSAFLK